VFVLGLTDATLTCPECYLVDALLIVVIHSVGGDSLFDTFTQRPLNLTIVYFIRKEKD